MARQPPIGVPTIVLHGADGGVDPAGSSAGDGRHFIGRYERRVLAWVGHDLPQEAPDATVAAIRTLLGGEA